MKYHWKLPEYVVWCTMRSRCHKESSTQWNYYGARGIVVCERWRKSFHAFYEDMGPKPSKLHSLDRIDNNGNYEPKNCRWATKEEQANNTRSNVFLTLNDETKTLSAWARHCGHKESTLRKRLKMGWALEKALFTPKNASMFGREPPNKGKKYKLKNPGWSQRPRES